MVSLNYRELLYYTDPPFHRLMILMMIADSTSYIYVLKPEKDISNCIEFKINILIQLNVWKHLAKLELEKKE